MQIHGNEKQGIPCTKELFVVGSGTIYQLKCEEVAVRGGDSNEFHLWAIQHNVSIAGAQMPSCTH